MDSQPGITRILRIELETDTRTTENRNTGNTDEAGAEKALKNINDISKTIKEWLNLWEKDQDVVKKEYSKQQNKRTLRTSKYHHLKQWI